MDSSPQIALPRNSLSLAQGDKYCWRAASSWGFIDESRWSMTVSMCILKLFTTSVEIGLLEPSGYSPGVAAGV